MTPPNGSPQAISRRSPRSGRRTQWGLLVGCIVVVSLFRWNFERARVEGRSMEPTFHGGQSLLVWRTVSLFGAYRVGDVIVFRDSRGAYLVKRIAFIQDAMNRMPDQLWTPRGMIATTALLRIASKDAFPGYEENLRLAAAHEPLKKTIFVLGDNFPVAEDSRDFGPLSPSEIVGKVVLPSAATG